MTASALTGQGIDQIWKMISSFKETMISKGLFEAQRNHQQVAWFREYFSQLLNADLLKYPALVSKRRELEQLLTNLEVSSYTAAKDLLKVYHESVPRKSS
jgi:LAO/AO transport system kinase